MKRDHTRPNGTIKRTQYVDAPQGGTSSMGTQYKKGHAILHMSSSRSTGETFVLTREDVSLIMSKGPGRWWSPTKWLESMRKKYLAANPGQKKAVAAMKKIEKLRRKQSRERCQFRKKHGLTTQDPNWPPEHTASYLMMRKRHDNQMQPLRQEYLEALNG